VYDGRAGEFRVLSEIQITPANVELATNSHQPGARLSRKFWTQLKQPDGKVEPHQIEGSKRIVGKIITFFERDVVFAEAFLFQI